jgi:hypothetical protein
MGIKLVEEVMDWCPDDVTPAQRWGLTVLARDANEVTRETFHGPEHPEILRRVRMSPKRWESVRSELLKRGLIEPVSGGFRGKAIRYRIASLFAPCVVADRRKTPEIQGAFGGYSPVRVAKDPRIPGVNQGERPPGSGGQSTERPPGSGGPTPPSSFSSSKPSSPRPPTQRTEPPAPPAPREEEDSNNNTNRARLLLGRLPAPWTLGPLDAQRLAPQLAQAAEHLGWPIDDRLAAAICTNPGGMNNPADVLAKLRIPNLLPYAQIHGRRSNLPPACPTCLDENPHAALNARFRTHNGTAAGRPCPTCHPDQLRPAA